MPIKVVKEMMPRKYESESKNFFSLLSKVICLNFNATTGNTHGMRFSIIPPRNDKKITNKIERKLFSLPRFSLVEINFDSKKIFPLLLKITALKISPR